MNLIINAISIPFHVSFFLLNAFQPSKSDGIFMLSMPRNTVGIVGKSVILECSLSSKYVDVQWFYSADENNYEILSKNEQYKRKKFFKKIDVLYRASSDVYAYDLRINNIQLQDSGFYSCLLSLENRSIVKTAHMSVIKIEKCKAYVVGYKLSHVCEIHTAGSTEFSFSWKCDRTAEGFRSFNKSMVWNMLNQLIHVQVFNIGVQLDVMIDRTLHACDFETVAINLKPFKDKHVDVKVPFFEFVLSFYQSEITLLLDNIPNCLLEDDGELKLEYYYQFLTNYAKKHRLIVPRIPNEKFTCSLAQMFIKKPLLIASTPRASPSKLYARCDLKNGMKCLGFFIPYINEETNFVNVNRDNYHKLCDHQRDVSVCLDRIQPCFMTKNLKGLIEAYKFFCTSDYLLLQSSGNSKTIDPDKCFEHYPQIMTRLKINAHTQMKFFDSSPIRAPVLHKAFCSYLAGLAKSYCIEHLLASRSSLPMSEWYHAFFQILKQITDHGLFAFKESLAENHQYLIDCKGPFKSDKETKECRYATECAPVLG